jgi:methylthioribose-1-phosphate isomerase
MNIKGKYYRTIWLKDKSTVQIIDQRYLPHKFIIENLKSIDEVTTAIKDMHVRGAGLIGATAGYGMYLAVLTAPEENFNKYIKSASEKLIATRPTAINLSFAVKRQLSNLKLGKTLLEKIKIAKETAVKIADEDSQSCRKIGEHGLKIIEKISKKKKGPVNILTHCNAGWLAFVDYGSATAPIYLAHDKGIKVHVWVDETRPRNQGARLTAWELLNHGVPHKVIADNVGGHLMQHGMVDLVIVGSDRTTYTGDVANKIGTYLKALAAKDNRIPFYVALPSSTFDWKIRDGIKEIPIEERGSNEVKYIQGLCEGSIKEILLTPEKSLAVNFAFDVTPSRLVTGLITERGICKANQQSILKLYPKYKNMEEKGYVKFKCNWKKTKLSCNINKLNRWRTKLYKLELIGVNDNGIGFGNISQRIKEQKFIITGTGTGSLPILTKNHYTVVEECDIEHNKVTYKGPIKASSESMSHATIYKFLPNINAVIHVHNHAGWKKLLNKIPTTSTDAQYGTTKLAEEIKRLLEKTDLKKVRIFVTAGHPDGIFSFGRTIQEAEEVLLTALGIAEIDKRK